MRHWQQWASQDSWEQHAADTLREAYWLADPRIVELLCREAPAAIAELARYGVQFAREDDGRLTQRFFGAHRWRRTCFAGDYTGREIQRALVGRAAEAGAPPAVRTEETLREPTVVFTSELHAVGREFGDRCRRLAAKQLDDARVSRASKPPGACRPRAVAAVPGGPSSPVPALGRQQGRCARRSRRRLLTHTTCTPRSASSMAAREGPPRPSRSPHVAATRRSSP